ncbi:MAG TPA: double zinc ribbon domain-containing protein, partial [Anaerolineales bacterium]
MPAIELGHSEDRTKPVEHFRPAYLLFRWAWASLDWLLPPHCGGCGQPGSRWCTVCQGQVALVPAQVCPCCGQAQDPARLCPACRASPPGFTALRSWAFYGGPLQQAIKALKYRGDVALGEILARPLIQRLFELDWKIDLVVPVPAGAARQAQRGYNQAALLARPVALGCGLRYNSHALVKMRETRSQVGLTRRERQINVLDAFRADAK